MKSVLNTSVAAFTTSFHVHSHALEAASVPHQTGEIVVATVACLNASCTMHLTQGVSCGTWVLLLPLTAAYGCMQIIDKIVEHHLHRVYVVNDQGQAVGVVTLTDLLRRVTEEARKG